MELLEVHMCNVCMKYDINLSQPSARMRSEGYCSRPVCVCVCFRGPHLRLAQLSDKLNILAVSV